jgi:hypothetical protein
MSGMLNSAEGKKNKQGLLLTVLLSVLILFFFYGKLLRDPNKVYFGAGGDGLQSYYGALYHVQYDSTYIYFQGMNYPYGDISFYGGAFQPFIADAIKYISAHLIDISPYTIGIINVIMLASIILCAVVMYLLFLELKLPAVYSAVVAVGITYLSPQIGRLIGHYSLTYLFATPLTFLLLIRFNRQPKILISVYIGIMMFLLTGMHLYFFGMLGGIILFYWLMMFITDKRYRKPVFITKHLMLQMILPYMLIQLPLWMYDHITDRTVSPWGYLFYVSSWEGVLLPIHKPLGDFIEKFIHIRNVEWEGIAFVGITSTIVFMLLLFHFFKNIFSGRIKEAFKPTDQFMLNQFFWVSILALLFSFGLPFIIPGCEHLLDYLGIIRQMRSVGRFNWIFFYAINITSFYLLYQLIEKRTGLIKQLLLILPVLLLYIDAYYQNASINETLNNRITQLEDKENKLPENEWLRFINVKDYQAIIPLPYYHVGSESIWIAPESPIHEQFLIASLKTGLPLTAVHLNRTSLSQTYKNLSMVFEPYRRPAILQDCRSAQPFLLLVRKDETNEYERNLITKSKWLSHNALFDVYRLDYIALLTIADSLGIKAKEQMDSLRLYQHNDLFSTDSARNFVYVDYNERKSDSSYRGPGAYQSSVNNNNIIFDGMVPYDGRNNTYVLNFWLCDIRKDLYARTEFVIDYFDEKGNIYYTDQNAVFRYLATVDGGWALFQREFAIARPTRIRVTLKNHVPFGKDIFVDELLIRPTNVHLYKMQGKEIYKDDRFYPLP